SRNSAIEPIRLQGLLSQLNLVLLTTSLMPFTNGTWITYFTQNGVPSKTIMVIHGGNPSSSITVPC
ncbi:hypothetical protein, partial [Prochlorococcus marinus]|uniref:hypothetical protein n=1 Tax=Prochlorococcus marinus TaxID=1219 RepID=UPI001F2FAB5A